MISPASPGPWVAAALVLAGGILLLVGRRLFWLVVAVVGSAVGALVVSPLLPDARFGTRLVLALAGGLVGGLLALLVPRLAAAAAGAGLGVVVVSSLLPVLGWQPERRLLVVVLAATAVLAAVAALRLLELALGILAAGIGALLVVAALPLGPTAELLLLAGLWVAGAVYQGSG